LPRVGQHGSRQRLFNFFFKKKIFVESLPGWPSAKEGFAESKSVWLSAKASFAESLPRWLSAKLVF
jgi:hypothetical protein